MADSIKVHQILGQEAGTLAYLASDLDSALSMMKIEQNKGSFYGFNTCFEIGFTQEVTATAMFNSDSHLDNLNAEYAEKIDCSVDSN